MNLSTKQYNMILNVLIGGSLVTFLGSTILATLVFDSVSPDSEWTPQDIEMGMAVQATDQHIEVYQDAVLNIHVIIDMMNITKRGSEGEDVPGSIADLFPFGEPAVGKGTIIMKIETVSNDAMPNLSNKTQTVSPMAYIRSETFGEFIKSFLKLSAVGLKTWRYLVFLSVLGAFGLIGIGVLMIYLDLKNTPVESLDDDEDDDEE